MGSQNDFPDERSLAERGNSAAAAGRHMGAAAAHCRSSLGWTWCSIAEMDGWKSERAEASERA